MSLIKNYESFLLSNGQQIQQIESSLRSLTWFLPGRFADADLASETLYTLVNLVSFYHNTLLGRILTLKRTPMNRLIKYLHTTLPRYQAVASILSILRIFELLVEMSVGRWEGVATNQIRWRAILVIESLKTACRLYLFKLSGWRKELKVCTPERDVDLSGPTGRVELLEEGAGWKGPRTQREYLRLSHLMQEPSDSNESKPLFSPTPQEYLVEKAVNAACHPLLLTRPLEGIEWLGEFAHITRPLIYSLSMTRWGEQSWLALVVSFCADLFSLATYQNARRVAKTPNTPSSAWGVSLLSHQMRPTPLEEQEMKRRGWLLLLYLIRDPFYSAFTKHRLEGWIQWGLKRWVLSIGAQIAQDYKPMWENYHFLKN